MQLSNAALILQHPPEPIHRLHMVSHEHAMRLYELRTKMRAMLQSESMNAVANMTSSEVNYFKKRFEKEKKTGVGMLIADALARLQSDLEYVHNPDLRDQIREVWDEADRLLSEAWPTRMTREEKKLARQQLVEERKQKARDEKAKDREAAKVAQKQERARVREEKKQAKIAQECANASFKRDQVQKESDALDRKRERDRIRKEQREARALERAEAKASGKTGRKKSKH